MINPCVAHRGASSLAPENTMAAFDKAMSYPFVQWIELDVQLSRNGVPFVIHDEQLNRTTSGAGPVSDFTSAQLARLDAGRWFSRAFAGERIPTLERVLDATIGRCRLNIEMKAYGKRQEGLERGIVELLYAKGLQHDAVVTSFDPLKLRNVKAIAPDVRTGLITETAPSTLPADLERIGATFLSISHKRVTPALTAAMRACRVSVMAWTVNDAATMRRLAAIDPELMICTNYPDRFGKLLEQSSESSQT